MRRRIILLPLIIFLSISLSGQSDFNPGFIIALSNDTTYGYIENRSPKLNSSACIFKPDQQSKSIKYKPDELFGYRFIEGKYYISKVIKSENKSNKFFLEYLVDGLADLYVLMNMDGAHYFIEKDSTLWELKQSNYEVSKNDIKYIRTDKEYLSILKIMFQDTPELYEEIDNVYLGRKSLMKITEDYHNLACTEYSCHIYSKKLPRIKFSVGLTGGLNSSSIADKEIIIRDLPLTRLYKFSGPFNTSIQPDLGIHLNMLFPYWNTKFSFQYEALVNSKRFQSQYSIIQYHEVNWYDYEINVTTLQNNFILRYDLSKRKFRPFIQIGGTLNINLDTKYKGLEQTKWFDSNTYFGYCFGLGLAYKLRNHNNINIRFTINKSSNLFNYYNLSEFAIALEVPIVSF